MTNDYATTVEQSLAGKVVFITGLARGQGRSHAIHAAAAGADIIGLDAITELPHYEVDLSTEDDLAETVRQVESLGRSIVALPGDVRDLASVQAVVKEGLAQFGRIDGVVANAGIMITTTLSWKLTESEVEDVINTNLTGVWRTVRAAVPTMIEAQNGGSIVLISSGASLRAQPHIVPYVAAKTGVIGLMRGLALELAQYNIRVNVLSPGTTNTPMFDSPATRKLFVPETEPTDELFLERTQGLSALPVGALDPSDITDGVMFLLSDRAKRITGVNLNVDAGYALL